MSFSRSHPGCGLACSAWRQAAVQLACSACSCSTSSRGALRRNGASACSQAAKCTACARCQSCEGPGCATRLSRAQLAANGCMPKRPVASTCSRLRSTSAASSGRPMPATACAAARLKPPSKTDTAVSAVRSCADSRAHEPSSMAARLACSGRAAGGARPGSRCSKAIDCRRSRAISVAGSRRTQLAASSMASGRPPTASTMSSTAASCGAKSKSGRAAQARNSNSRTASKWRAASRSRLSSSGASRPASGRSHSPAQCRRSREVTSSVSVGAAASRRSAHAGSSARCSALSSASSVRSPCSAAATWANVSA